MHDAAPVPCLVFFDYFFDKGVVVNMIISAPKIDHTQEIPNAD